MAQPRIALFVTCLVDLFRPSIGFAAVKLAHPIDGQSVAFLLRQDRSPLLASAIACAENVTAHVEKLAQIVGG